ncbi:tRNA dimethylallyltransferase [Ranunculus cassubicifolius]
MAKPKIVIIMGATGAGKSKLAIDLSSHFPIEIINADSMQVYKSLDILTNKVPLHEQKGVPHHLLGIIPPNVEFTSKDFRDSAIQIIDEIISRHRLPVIVGGTNYYIQALVSPFLLGDLVEEMDDLCLKDDTGDKGLEYKFEEGDEESGGDYQRLKEIDPESADRIHPNDFRKISQYLGVYARTSVLPSRIFKGKASEKWGRSYDFRYDCCFVCVDASLPVLDQFVEDRVDCMIEAGLLYEVSDIYNLNADYTRGLRQAIGVREFEEFLSVYVDKIGNLSAESSTSVNLKMVLESDGGQHKILLTEAINRLKANTKRLVRRQKRRFSRLQALFGWELHYVDATESLLVEIITSFLDAKTRCLSLDVARNALDERDLWTSHVCEPCGNRLLRGAHEWEQHKQGRGHRKRIAGLKKAKQIMSRIATVGSNETHCPTLW